MSQEYSNMISRNLVYALTEQLYQILLTCQARQECSATGCSISVSELMTYSGRKRRAQTEPAYIQFIYSVIQN